MVELIIIIIIIIIIMTAFSYFTNECIDIFV